MASTQPKKNVKTSYRSDKKPSMAARKKAAKTIALRNKKTAVQTPAISLYRISGMAADTFGVILIFTGALFLFSLKFSDMNSITEWCFRNIRLYTGKSAILIGFLAVFFWNLAHNSASDKKAVFFFLENFCLFHAGLRICTDRYSTHRKHHITVYFTGSIRRNSRRCC